MQVKHQLYIQGDEECEEKRRISLEFNTVTIFGLPAPQLYFRNSKGALLTNLFYQDDWLLWCIKCLGHAKATCEHYIWIDSKDNVRVKLQLKRQEEKIGVWVAAEAPKNQHGGHQKSQDGGFKKGVEFDYMGVATILTFLMPHAGGGG